MYQFETVLLISRQIGRASSVAEKSDTVMLSTQNPLADTIFSCSGLPLGYGYAQFGRENGLCCISERHRWRDLDTHQMRLQIKSF